MEKNNNFKYIIIDTTTHEVVIKNSYRSIADFINLIYPNDKISHNAVGERLRAHKYFNYYDLLIKELLWI
tara:strand:- start:1258 stop:1467 length:210 start_codon:yes stop_codon:yes gene_type:complete